MLSEMIEEHIKMTTENTKSVFCRVRPRLCSLAPSLLCRSPDARCLQSAHSLRSFCSDRFAACAAMLSAELCKTGAQNKRQHEDVRRDNSGSRLASRVRSSAASRSSSATGCALCTGRCCSGAAKTARKLSRHIRQCARSSKPNSCQLVGRSSSHQSALGIR